MKNKARNEELFLAGDFDTLYKENQGLMNYIAKRYLSSGIEMDDLLGLGNIAFVKAVEKFDPSVAKWSTYFPLVMNGEILKYIRDSKKSIKSISIEDVGVYHKEGGKELSFIDTVVDDMDMEHDILERHEKLEKMKHLSILEDKELECLNLRLEGIPQAQIAKRIGTSQAQVSRIILKALKKLEESRNGEFKKVYQTGGIDIRDLPLFIEELKGVKDFMKL